MNFFPWKKNQVLFINKFGVLEPIKTKVYVPDVCIPKYDKYLVDEGYHLNPKGAELYCKKIYESNLN